MGEAPPLFSINPAFIMQPYITFLPLIVILMVIFNGLHHAVKANQCPTFSHTAFLPRPVDQSFTAPQEKKNHSYVHPLLLFYLYMIL